MMTQENQDIYNSLSDDETICRLAKECIAKIDGAGGAGCKIGGAERVTKKMMQIIKKRKQKIKNNGV